MNTIKFTSAVSVDKGLIRNNNEDNFYFNGTYLYADERDKSNTFSSSPSDEIQIYGVFDGMGGEALGEEASLIAAQVMNKTHKKLKTSERNIEKEILASVEDANTKICKKIVESGEKRIGATFSTLVIENDNATVFNVGDSRVYLLRENKLQQVSIDDTTAQRLVNLGEITPEQAKTHKDRHKLTQHLGIFKDEMVIEPHISKEIEIKKGDKFLLCSDGLTDMLTDDEISGILVQNKTCEQLCKELVKAALKNGGKDNVTVVIIKAETEKKKKVLPFKKFVMPLSLILIFLLGYGVFSFINKDKPNDNKPVEVAQATNIYFSNPVSEIKIGTEDTFMVGVEPANTKSKISFTSSNPEIIKIDTETGFYKAISVGNSTIKAESGELSCELEIQVYKPVEDITDIPQKLSLNVGANKKIQYKLLPEDIKEKASFVSENESIVTVTRDGIVEAHSAGKTNIIISVYDYSESIEVTVIENKPNKADDTSSSGSKNGTNTEQKSEEHHEETTPAETIKSPDNTESKETQQPEAKQDSGREIVQDDTVKQN